LALPTPPWRDLGVGDKGDDVEALQELLVSLGYETPVSGSYDRATGRAVAALWGAIGGDKDQTGLPQSQVVWLPQRAVTPSQCLAVVGHRLTAGEPFIRTGGIVGALQVALPEDCQPGPRIATFEEQTTPLGEDGVIADADFVAAFAASPAFLTALETSDWGSLRLETDLAEPLPVAAVPPSALYGVEGVNACIMDAQGPLPVRIIASELGETMVTGETLPTRVAIDPGTGGQPCG
jgi:hypothetical protein